MKYIYETIDEIKKELKEAGISEDKYTISGNTYCGYEYITINIIKPCTYKHIYNVATKYTDIRRDEKTKAILECNRKTKVYIGE